MLLGVASADGLDELLVGEMAKLDVLETPVSVAGITITDMEGAQRTLEEKRGKVLLINLWSKGCAPCKSEMPDLDLLQRELGGENFEVVALPMEKRSANSSRKILAKWGAENLPAYGNDPQALARSLNDAGLFTEKKISFVYPTTYLVNPEGEIVAVREGFLHWDVPEARALIRRLMDN
jgi:thiol-disulfide isomerase/thioredoxin